MTLPLVRSGGPGFIDVEAKPEKLNDLPRATQLTRDFRPGFKPRYLLSQRPSNTTLSLYRQKEMIRMHAKIIIIIIITVASIYCLLYAGPYS